MRPQGFHRRQCTAKSKRSGERCKNYACRNRPTCRMHGGKSLSGAAHPNFKHGEHSTWLANAVYKQLCPKCLRTHGTIADQERQERTHAKAYLRGYAMGREHGYSDGNRDATRNKDAATNRKRHSIASPAPTATGEPVHKGDNHA